MPTTTTATTIGRATISREGRRIYVRIAREDRAEREALKTAGAHWEPDRTAWWIGSGRRGDAAIAALERIAAEREAAPQLVPWTHPQSYAVHKQVDIRATAAGEWDRGRKLWLVDPRKVDELTAVGDRIQAEVAARRAAERDLPSISMWTTSRHASPCSEGCTLTVRGEVVTVERVSRPRFDAECMSMGAPDDDHCWSWRIWYRPATEEEERAHRDDQERRQQRIKARSDLMTAARSAVLTKEEAAALITDDTERLKVPGGPLGRHDELALCSDGTVVYLAYNGGDGDGWAWSTYQCYIARRTDLTVADARRLIADAK